MPPNPRHTTETCNGIYDTHTQYYYSSMLKLPGHELRQVSGVRRIHALLYLSKLIRDQEISTMNCADSEQGKWNHFKSSFFNV